MANKIATSFRLSSECLALIGELAAENGLSQAGVIEMAVRQLARRRVELGQKTRKNPGEGS